MKLTTKNIAAITLPEGKTDYVFYDDDISGFGLRIRAGGSKTWIFRYRAGKLKQRSLTLGNVKSVPLVTARETAGELEARIRLGHDPAVEKAERRAAADNTIEIWIDKYLDERRPTWRPATARAVTHHLLTQARPLHGLSLSSVSQATIARLLDKVAKTSGVVASNRLRASLQAFFAWALKKDVNLLPRGNIASVTERRDEKPRERALTENEIRAIWRALGEDDYSDILKLLLLTGQRRGEISGLRWSEVNGGFIELPGDRTKNGRPHIIPLSPAAKVILDKPRIAGRTFVFGRDDTNGFRGWGICKRRLDERLGKSVAPWTVHDLRRTCATGMIGLGTQPHIVEAVLNHIGGHRAGVAGIYNRATYDTEKRDALDRWAAHVLAVVTKSQAH